MIKITIINSQETIQRFKRAQFSYKSIREIVSQLYPNLNQFTLQYMDTDLEWVELMEEDDWVICVEEHQLVSGKQLKICIRIDNEIYKDKAVKENLSKNQKYEEEEDDGGLACYDEMIQKIVQKRLNKILDKELKMQKIENKKNRIKYAEHKNITCKICGMSPIIGPRFKSLVSLEYNLCENCEKVTHLDSPMVKITTPSDGHYWWRKLGRQIVSYFQNLQISEDAESPRNKLHPRNQNPQFNNWCSILKKIIGDPKGETVWERGTMHWKRISPSIQSSSPKDRSPNGLTQRRNK